MIEPVDLTKPLSGVRYERRDHIATITLDRPERGNSLAPPMQADPPWWSVKYPQEILEAKFPRRECGGRP